MTATYDLGTAIGKTRLYSKDTIISSPRFTDEEIYEFLEMENGDPRLAAAVSLEVTASSRALMAKISKVDDITFETPEALTSALLSLAGNLRKLVQNTGAARYSMAGIKRTETYRDI